MDAITHPADRRSNIPIRELAGFAAENNTARAVRQHDCALDRLVELGIEAVFWPASEVPGLPGAVN